MNYMLALPSSHRRFVLGALFAQCLACSVLLKDSWWQFLPMGLSAAMLLPIAGSERFSRWVSRLSGPLNRV